MTRLATPTSPGGPVRNRWPGSRPGPAAWLAAALLCSACGGASKQARSYSDSARGAYERALSDLRSGNCLDAGPAFHRIRRRYPYSRFAALAELRSADCLFEQGKYVESIPAYRRFVRYRPSHSEVPYARFRIAQAYFEQIPTDWALAPPAHERDQAPTVDALNEIRRFLQDYSDYSYANQAKRMARAALRLLARHELYAARFYLNRDHPIAAVGRLRTLLRSYQGSGLEPEALLLLGRTYLKLRDGRHAKEAFGELVTRFPRSSQAAEAKDWLRSADS
ncbi:MAG: outer membrane protein assembly factor BamD [Proteobacteria bacterium]|nr:outer membrane protein assembly factor BamD [Pseudomonadota bacterium]